MATHPFRKMEEEEDEQTLWEYFVEEVSRKWRETKLKALDVYWNNFHVDMDTLKDKGKKAMKRRKKKVGNWWEK